MNSQTYISDPKIWEAFYKNMAEKKFNPYKYKPKQIGRGMRKQKSYVIPIRPHSLLEPVNPIPQVTPMAAVEERAKSEHVKDVQEGVPFIKVTNGIKRPSQHSSVIPTKKLKTSTSHQRRKDKKINLVKKKQVSKKKTNGRSKKRHTSGGKKASQKPKKLFKIDRYKNVFKQ